ncbi:MAG: hypothetical protein ABI397_03445 [Candidatus Saccharimonas sp.]
MDRAENSLPPDESLEGNTVSCKDELYAKLNTLLKEGGDVIDIQVELKRNILAILEYSELVSHLARKSEDEQRKIRDAVYRSICFATQIADDLLSGTYVCDLVAYVRENLSSDGYGFAPLMKDCSEYLQARPEVYELIKHYMPEIDRSGSYSDIAELFAGIVCMLSERSVAEQYLSASMGEVGVQDFLGNQEPN